MNIKIHYRGQLAAHINSTTEEITIASPISLIDLLTNLTEGKDTTLNVHRTSLLVSRSPLGKLLLGSNALKPIESWANYNNYTTLAIALL